MDTTKGLPFPQYNQPQRAIPRRCAWSEGRREKQPRPNISCCSLSDGSLASDGSWSSQRNCCYLFEKQTKKITPRHCSGLSPHPPGILARKEIRQRKAEERGHAWEQKGCSQKPRSLPVQVEVSVMIGRQPWDFNARPGDAPADVPHLPSAVLAAPARWNGADGDRARRSCMSSSPSLAEGDI